MICTQVPIFRKLSEEQARAETGQLYKAGDAWFVLDGYVPGCGREVDGWCKSCRSFMPVLAEKPSRNARRKTGKDEEVTV
jgi:hypothetical protein